MVLRKLIAGSLLATGLVIISHYTCFSMSIGALFLIVAHEILYHH